MSRVADHPIDAQFTARWSPRAFTDQPVSKAQVLSLLEAARWAPSASNHQPWRFAYGLRGDEGFARILAGLVPFNQGWAGKAAALIVVASRVSLTRDGAEHPNPWHAFDAGAAWMALALQAHHDGLAAHAMGGIEAKALAESLSLPETYSIHAVVAVGYRGEKDLLPEGLQAREVPSPRLPIDQLAGHGAFK